VILRWSNEGVTALIEVIVVDVVFGAGGGRGMVITTASSSFLWI
jgi:hypothetical protein